MKLPQYDNSAPNAPLYSSKAPGNDSWQGVKIIFWSIVGIVSLGAVALPILLTLARLFG